MRSCSRHPNRHESVRFSPILWEVVHALERARRTCHAVRASRGSLNLLRSRSTSCRDTPSAPRERMRAISVRVREVVDDPFLLKDALQRRLRACRRAKDHIVLGDDRLELPRARSSAVAGLAPLDPEGCPQFLFASESRQKKLERGCMVPTFRPQNKFQEPWQVDRVADVLEEAVARFIEVELMLEREAI